MEGGAAGNMLQQAASVVLPWLCDAQLSYRLDGRHALRARQALWSRPWGGSRSTLRAGRRSQQCLSLHAPRAGSAQICSTSSTPSGTACLCSKHAKRMEAESRSPPIILDIAGHQCKHKELRVCMEAARAVAVAHLNEPAESVRRPWTILPLPLSA